MDQHVANLEYHLAVSRKTKRGVGYHAKPHHHQLGPARGRNDRRKNYRRIPTAYVSA